MYPVRRSARRRLRRLRQRPHGPYDDEGHGTHVAGIIAGNGHDSLGRHAGIAPDAALVALKVLDANGRGTISNAIAALDWVLAHHQQYNIRVVNLSVGAAVRESYWTDPLTLAAKRVADAGVVVVTAAGNLGKNARGRSRSTAASPRPGNAPWVLTVGASSTNGSLTRDDDSMATFSSRGPTYLDWSAKPDLVASGVGTISLSAPNSTFYATKAAAARQRVRERQRARVPDAERHQHGRAGRRRHRCADAAGQSVADAERGEGDPAVHRRAARRLQRADAGRRLPERDWAPSGWRDSSPSAQPGAAYPLQAAWSKQDHLGQPPSLGRRPRPLGECVRARNDLGCRARERRREHHLGHDLRRRVRQHHLGHVRLTTTSSGAPAATTTSSGAPTPKATTSSGARKSQTTTSSGAPTAAAPTATTSSGARTATATTSSGARPATTTTSSGAPTGEDNIIWGTAGDDADNIIWGTDDLDNIIWGTADRERQPPGRRRHIRCCSGTTTTRFTVSTSPGLTDDQFFDLIDALTSVLNPWVLVPPVPKLGSL